MKLTWSRNFGPTHTLIAEATPADASRHYVEVTPPLNEGEGHPSLARLLWSRIDAVRVSGFALGAALVAAVGGGVLIGLVLGDVGFRAG